MRKPTALVRSGVSCAGNARPSAAPCGEYQIAEEEGAVRFTSAPLAKEFTLSIDAFCRLVAEGRISVRAD